MKKLIMLVLLISTLFAKEIILKHRIFVNNCQDLQYAIDNMPEDSIIDANITNLYFDQNITIRNKKNLKINFINDINYGKVFIENSKNIEISGANKGFYDVRIDINNSKNIILDNFYILSYLFKLNVDNSKVKMLNINYSKNKKYDKKFSNFKSSYFTDYYINVNNSIFSISNANLKGDKVFNINNSNFIINHIYLNNENYYSNKQSSLIQVSNSIGIIKNSLFENIFRVILNINSNLEIKNDKFINNKFPIIFSDEAKGKIIDNVLNNDSDSNQEGIELYKDSQALIYNNKFSNMKFGIRLNNSKADIKENEFSFINNFPIKLLSSSVANLIKNNNLSSKYSMLYFIDETSEVFSNDSIKEFYTETDDCFLNYPIDINIPEVEIDESKFKFDHFKFLENVRTFSIETFKERSLIKGVLKENLVISLPNGDEDEIEKGTHLVIKTENNGDKKSYFIVKPKEYKDCKLDKIPNLKREYNFKLSTFSEKKGNKIRFSFEIKSDKPIKSIYFKNDHPLTLIKNIDYYQTKPRRKIFNNKNNVLIIKFNDDSIKTFNCLIDNNKTLQCNPIKKINF